MDFQQRLNAVIPGGAHTYSRGFDQFPSNAPQILERGEGAYVWAPDGRKFLDYGMALRAVTLGYAFASVIDAAMCEARKGNNLTRATVTELEAAELIVDLIPSADMVKFAKNGSNATTAAMKIARAYTGRPLICVPRQQPFFSFDDWFIGTTPMTRGIPGGETPTTLLFDYGDAASLEALFDQHTGRIGAVMLEPATHLTPCRQGCSHQLSYDAPCPDCTDRTTHFLHAVQALCRQHGAVFILDEMVTGFRWHLQGAQKYFGVTPDMSTFGKGMANGFSLAAVVGRRDIMEVGSIDKPGAERTFLLSTTHGGEMAPLGAFIEAVRVYRERDVCRHLWSYGQRLKDGLSDVAKRTGTDAIFRVDGPAISMHYVLSDASGAVSLPLRTLFSQEMIRHGVLMPWLAISLAHGDAELDLTLHAAEQALTICGKAVHEGIERYLEGPAVKPVFRKYN